MCLNCRPALSATPWSKGSPNADGHKGIGGTERGSRDFQDLVFLGIKSRDDWWPIALTLQHLADCSFAVEVHPHKIHDSSLYSSSGEVSQDIGKLCCSKCQRIPRSEVLCQYSWGFLSVPSLPSQTPFLQDLGGLRPPHCTPTAGMWVLQQQHRAWLGQELQGSAVGRAHRAL